MNNNMNSAMKTVGVSLAVGTAAAVMSTDGVYAAVCERGKRKMKKAAKKAANTINTIVDNMQDMIK